MARRSTPAAGLVLLGLLALLLTSQSGLRAPPRERIAPAQAERDEIYMLLAYALVLKNWEPRSASGRGHNIGAVLVDPEGSVIAFELNASVSTRNGTEHAEARLLRNHLRQSRSFAVQDHVVYTTLEPCAMCGGMMMLLDVPRTVYGQSDPGYGKALDRLALDSHELPGGYPPYPRTVISLASASPIRAELDAAFAAAQRRERTSLSSWLRTVEAKAIYEKALERFRSLAVEHPENAAILRQARSFYDEAEVDDESSAL